MFIYDEAVLMLKSFSEKPKVLLNYHWIPEKTGLEAIKEFLQLDNRVNIIFISADTSIKEEALSNSAFSFWEQLFTIKQLLNVIINAFEVYNS